MRRWMAGLRMAGLAGVLAVAAAPGLAGTVCRSPGITGFEVQARTARLVLASTRADTQAIEVYVARTPFGFYYESNYVAPGTAWPAKIYAPEPLNVRALVENLLFTSRADADAGAALTDAVIASHLTIRLDAALFDGTDPTGLDNAIVIRRVAPAQVVWASR